MTSHELINSLNEHLVRALKELKAKEQSLLEAREALGRLQRKFAVVIHQQVCVPVANKSVEELTENSNCQHVGRWKHSSACPSHALGYN